ncbi:Phosphatidylglycerophosphatase A [Oleispira antarctica RB-8]|uniref:Phosphatidylglycerophosphatase A n=1 Tax=Oleispira antarctica RB-8 TaxID=698738 RepID=R4YUD0_OLEAN|nr:Phosphatidylglycerophosphatase A [Oleispira antarctica RB-8]|tara:strand:- start:1352 stop:1828 length:477 start_codon:yes stop_codon:yes gene_type:complete
MTSTVKPNLRNPIHLLAFGLGSGCAPKAPGTFGTLAAIPFWWLFLQDVPLIPYLCVLIAGFAFGVYLCEQTSKDLGVHDHGGIVWDEWIGLWITYLALPAGIEWVIIGFALFRFFDILKPWPIKWLDEKVHGGFGIMIDDVLAGIFALICVQGLAYFF